LRHRPPEANPLFHLQSQSLGKPIAHRAPLYALPGYENILARRALLQIGFQLVDLRALASMMIPGRRRLEITQPLLPDASGLSNRLTHPAD